MDHLQSEIAVDDQEPPERPLQVLIANETDASIDLERLEMAVRSALADSPYSQGDVSVAIVDDPTIHKLNRQFLAHDYPTDVLSFSLEDDPPALNGEIIASLDAAIRCAADAGWSPQEELLLYVVHGALHLAGYDDKDPRDEAEMRAAEAAVLAQLGVVRSPQDSRWPFDCEGMSS